jgi:hypothetical protein
MKRTFAILFGVATAAWISRSVVPARPAILRPTTIHHFAEAGPNTVRAEGKGRDGTKAVTDLQVGVKEKIAAQAQTMASSWEPWLERKILPEVEARWMMRGFLDQQLRPIPLPATRESWLARRDALRREILGVLGLDDLVPPKWDLKVQNKGTIQREGYHIEKLTFESYPGMAISAVLYIPDDIKGRVPGIVSITGHTSISKAADYIQQRNVNLVRRGCIVLCYDYYGYGERKTGDKPDSPTGANGHDIRTFSYTRRCATSLEALDVIRALDVLMARPEVDPERIGFTGESGGSNSSYWAAALDPRIKLIVPVCSVTTYDYWIRTDVNWDWHQRPPGIRRIADIGTLLALHAPNPLLIISSHHGTDDEEFPLQEAEKSYQWAGHIYQLLGAENAVRHYESTTAHGYQEDKRQQLYASVELWLRPPFPKGVEELPAKVESVEELRCGLPEKNLTFRDIFAEWLRPLPRTNGVFDATASRKFLRERLALPQPAPELKAEKISEDEQGPWFAEFWLVEPEPGVRLPAVRIGRMGVAAPMTLVPGRDKQAVARALDAGQQVVAFDLRGTGEMRHGEGGNWSWMAGSPWPEILGEAGGSLSNWAWLAGRPWPGMWALDLHQVARFCRGQLGASVVAVDAQNNFGWAALLAAAAAPELLESGTVQLRLASLHDAVRARGDAALADVPGLLEQLDIPQLRQLWPGGQVKVVKD